MKKFKKLIAMCLTAAMALSMMSIGAFAATESAEPTSYTTEDGITVTLYDPDITVEFTEKTNNGITRASSITGYVYIANPTNGIGNATETFSATGTGTAKAKFGLDLWEGGPSYNVSLCKVGANGSASVLAVCENIPKIQEATLNGLAAPGNYFFRVSTYYTPGNASYYAYAQN
ncbi:MAG: hypothetical protein IJA34_11315 [Lachnospiraceae bacterium]|nr:hypothetical protein [Lachnospiraceae bacterium]